MKRSKIPSNLAKNASKLHKKIGILLTESHVNPGFKSNREKFDWAILGLNVIIEVHGEQHYKPVCFGGISEEEAIEKYRDTKRRDSNKEEAAHMAGWAYVVVKYNEKDITEEELSNRIKEALAGIIITKSMGKIAKMIEESTKKKAKIQNKGFQKGKTKYKWPTRKLQSKNTLRS
jgi:cation transport regulator ChaB